MGISYRAERERERALVIYSWLPFLYSCIFQGYLGAGEFSAPPAARLLDRNQVSALLSLVAEQGRGAAGFIYCPGNVQQTSEVTGCVY